MGKKKKRRKRKGKPNNLERWKEKRTGRAGGEEGAVIVE